MNTKYLVLGPAAIAMAVLASGSAQAVNRFGVACIVNKTDRTLSYEIRLGDGAYTSKFLAPGYQTSYSHRYDKPDENSSTTLYVRFDSDLRGGKTNRSPTLYKLIREASIGDTCAEGAQYWFEYDGSSRNFLKLTRKKG